MGRHSQTTQPTTPAAMVVAMAGWVVDATGVNLVTGRARLVGVNLHRADADDVLAEWVRKGVGYELVFDGRWQVMAPIPRPSPTGPHRRSIGWLCDHTNDPVTALPGRRPGDAFDLQPDTSYLLTHDGDVCRLATITDGDIR